jgi:hypothetical protein
MGKDDGGLMGSVPMLRRFRGCIVFDMLFSALQAFLTEKDQGAAAATLEFFALVWPFVHI